MPHREAMVDNLAVLLLLGGQSRRMGTPKHLLQHPLTQKPLYRHHLSMLQLLCAEATFPRGVWVSARQDQLDSIDLPEDVRVVLDDREADGDIGPAAGILQAAAALPEANWLVLAVDLPFLSRESILHLLANYSPASPVSLYLHSDDGNPEPLFSVWSPQALDQLRENCRAGKSGPCRAAKDIWGGKIVEGRGGVKVPTEDWITDADTQEEWAEAQRRLHSTRSPDQAFSPVALTSLAHGRSSFAKSAYRATAFHDAISIIRSLPINRKRRATPVNSTGQLVSERQMEAGRLKPSRTGGCFTREDIPAVLSHPLEDNSAMDGYAVAATAITHASPSTSILLPVLGRVLAGDPPPVSSGDASTGCWEVMTGAVFPSPGFDSVVKVEDASWTNELDAQGRHIIAFRAPIHPGKNRRRRGEQFATGDVLLQAGEEVTPEAVMLLAAGGVKHVPPVEEPPASERPMRGRVAILATGKEVVSLSGHRTDLEPGQVVDCITPFLDSFLRSRDYEPVHLPSCGDSLADLSSALSTALATESFDLILTIAGVSLGSADHTPEALQSVVLTQQFHGVAIRPGGPVMLSLHEPTGTPVLSLPGNPMASAVCMRAFGEEILSRLDDVEEGGRDGVQWMPLGGEGEDDGEWSDWLAQQKVGVSTFAAVSLEANGTPAPPRNVPGSKCSGPCALGSLIGAGAWVRVDGARDGSPCRAYWRRF